jgi:putative ABC transport system substrate-binding protein
VKRTALLVTLALGLLAAPLAAGAQQTPRVPKIGLLRFGSPPDTNVAAFLQGLRDLGYVEGQNIAIEYRWAGGRVERIPELTMELVRLKVDVIVSTGDTGALAAKQATSRIPIVVPAVTDPVGIGVVATLARPGGNVTGLSVVNPELSEKRVELLKEMFPRIARVAVVQDARLSTTVLLGTEAAARTLGLRLQVLKAQSLKDFEDAFAAARRAQADALTILPSGLFWTLRARIVNLAAKTRLPAMYEQRDFVAAGGLMAYGPSVPDLFRRAATYVDRILKGAKPADLPVEQPTKFELVINLKTAKALGLTIPPSLLARADEVIE